MKKRPAIVVLGVVLVLVVAGWLVLPRVSWDGSAPVWFDVVVIDSNDGHPIPRATLAVVKQEDVGADLPTGLPRTGGQATTDADGRAVVAYAFGAGGQSRGLWREGRVSFLGYWLGAAADGYESRWIPVIDFTGASRSIRDRRFDVTIGLRRQAR